MDFLVPRVRLIPLLALGLALGVAATAGASTSTVQTSTARSAQIRTVAREALDALSVRTDQADSQWYANGVWHSKDTACWFCADGPGTLAATLWRVDGRDDPALFQQAVETFDRTIAAEQNANGSFGDARLPDTQFFANELGTTYLLLGKRLGPQHRTAWRAAIAGAADYLIAHGDLTWEANGNINLGNTEVEWLAWAITGEQRFHDAYELAWRYTIHPPQTGRWRGYGLHITSTTAGPTGHADAGYLAESGGKGPGFDPDYTMLQLSVASRAYLLSHDPRFRGLVDLLWNQLSPLVSRPSWHLNASNGTRRSQIVPLTTPALAVLATDGGAGTLLRTLDAQTAAAMYPTYLQNARQNWGNAGIYRGYGNELGVALLALASPPLSGTSVAPALGQSNVQGAGSRAGTHHLQTERLAVAVTSGGVQLSWHPIGKPARSDDQVDLRIDGKLVRRLHGSSATLHLSAGLYQVSVAQPGRAPRTSTTFTVPAA